MCPPPLVLAIVCCGKIWGRPVHLLLPDLESRTHLSRSSFWISRNRFRFIPTLCWKSPNQDFPVPGLSFPSNQGCMRGFDCSLPCSLCQLFMVAGSQKSIEHKVLGFWVGQSIQALARTRYMPKWAGNSRLWLLGFLE